MSSIKIECTCGQRVLVPTHASGQEFECPTCGGKLVVPEIPTKLDQLYAQVEQDVNLRPCRDCGTRISIRATACPHCGAPANSHAVAPPIPHPTPPPTGRAVKKGEFVGPGAAVQALGLLLTCTVFGAIAGIPLLIIGGRMAIKWVCSNCGNKVADRGVRMCPTCRATLN